MGEKGWDSTCERKTVFKDVSGKEKKPSEIIDNSWDNMGQRAQNTIELCLADEGIYNVMKEISIVGLWLKLESLYMTKSLSIKLYLNNQLYSLCMKEAN